MLLIMKYLKITLVLLLLSQAIIAHSQLEDTLGLRRLFWNIVPSTLLKTHGTYTEAEVVGVQFEIGNYWKLGQKNQTTGFFRLTWTKIGIHNYGLLLAPAQVGFGAHFDLNEKSSIDVMLNAGLVMSTEDALYPKLEFTYGVYPQIKYNINRFSIGFEYSYRRSHAGLMEKLGLGYHYLGLTIGRVKGKKIN